MPTYLLYQHITQEFATIFYHWFLLVQPPPFPETIVQNSAEYFLKCTLLWLGGSKLTDPLPDCISTAVFSGISAHVSPARYDPCHLRGLSRGGVD